MLGVDIAESLHQPFRGSRGGSHVVTTFEELVYEFKAKGSQLGDPVKGAEAMIKIAAIGEGPLNQLLGSDAYAFAHNRIAALTADVEAGRELALTTDHT